MTPNLTVFGVCVYLSVCYSVHVEVKRQYTEVGSTMMWVPGND